MCVDPGAALFSEVGIRVEKGMAMARVTQSEVGQAQTPNLRERSYHIDLETPPGLTPPSSTLIPSAQ